jgi:hypothetical protein
MSRNIWTIVIDRFVILDDKNLTLRDEENELLNDQAMNILYSSLDVSELNQVKNLKTANEIWKKLMEIHEGTLSVKEAKMYVLKEKFSEFAMKKDESVPDMFNRLNDIVNELKGLGFEVPDVDFSHKFLRSLPERYDTIVTLFVRSNLKATTPTEIFGEVLTHDMFKKSQDEVHGAANDEKKKNVAFEAQGSKEDSDDDCNGDESDEEMALFCEKI